MTTVPRSLAAAAMVVATATATAGCDGPSGLAKPEPATLVVRLAAPDAADRALIVELTGPAAVSAPSATDPSLLVQWRAQGTTLRAAVFGVGLNGPVLRFTIPDGAQASRYTASVVEAVDSLNLPRADLSAYRATIEPAPWG
ncbi:MAG TPA: hypothetical protein VFQ39_15090, partial [Longimicrobium sp.]|nr:hypothetical protein [Longimicrobium sp.]